MSGDSAPAAASGMSAPLVGKRITLCVTGSVAAYKAAAVARLLVRSGALVQPLMTRSALRFLGEATLAGLTGRRVLSDMFEAEGELHVSLAENSDLIAVVPATADVLARLAQGRSDDLLTATVLCARCPVLVAPAMHPSMWSHPRTAANVATLSAVPGLALLGPVEGEVASGAVGVGRMVEPEEVHAAITRTVGASVGRTTALAGRHVVVTAGPTLEDLDPVRFLGNRSSGKMGFALAESAARQGARVTLVAGPVALPTPRGVRRVDVRSALDMQAALAGLLRAPEGLDALLMCAAVSDYRPRVRASAKLKRRPGEGTLEIVANPDILAEIGAGRAGPKPFLLGFAVESASGEQLVAAARGKLAAKRVDAIVANAAEDALGRDDTRAILVTATSAKPLGPGSKSAVAEQIVSHVASQIA